MEFLSKFNIIALIQEVCGYIVHPHPFPTVKEQTVRQTVSGAITTALDLIGFQALIWIGVCPYFAAIITFCLTVLTNFSLTRWYVFVDFRRTDIISDFFLYSLSCLGSLLIVQVCLILFFGMAKFTPFTAKLLSIPVLFMWTIVFSRIIVLGTHKRWRYNMKEQASRRYKKTSLFSGNQQKHQSNFSQHSSDIMQTPKSLEKNSTYFLENIDTYSNQVYHLEGYQYMYEAISEKLKNMGDLLDIGNGGVFDYNVSLPKSITAVDLFLDKLPNDNTKAKNISLIKGDALALPFNEPLFDGCIMVMLLHHLIGNSVKDNYKNLNTSIHEAFKVLKPGGKLIIMESCVPPWFCTFEKKVFKIASLLISKTLKHPPTFQFTETDITNSIYSIFKSAHEIQKIPKGKYVLQFGFKVPTWVTPVFPVLFVVTKPYNGS